jgi:putative NADH-flavin reductase
VLDRALAEGYRVRALVRDPAQLAAAGPHLTVITGDVLDPEAVERTVEGSDAVLSLFGQVKGSSPTLQADGTALIVSAMQKHGVTRIVTLSGGGLPAPLDRPKPADKIIRVLLRVLSGHVLADAQKHLEVLEKTDLDWTVVRGPRLTEAPGAGRYRVGWVGVDAGTQISRDDLAGFILTQVDDRAFVRQMPFVSA